MGPYRQGFNTTEWNWISGQAYEISDLAYYEGMLYRANMAVSDDTTPPNYWIDDDNINDNVWQMLYPWAEGDSIILEPYGWYQDGDGWVADLSTIGELDNNDDEDVKLQHGSQYDEGKKTKVNSLKDIVNSIVPISSVGLSKKNR